MFHIHRLVRVLSGLASIGWFLWRLDVAPTPARVFLFLYALVGGYVGVFVLTSGYHQRLELALYFYERRLPGDPHPLRAAAESAPDVVHLSDFDPVGERLHRCSADGGKRAGRDSALLAGCFCCPRYGGGGSACGITAVREADVEDRQSGRFQNSGVLSVFTYAVQIRKMAVRLLRTPQLFPYMQSLRLFLPNICGILKPGSLVYTKGKLPKI